MELTIVDVFAERPLAGNQLAVVRQAAGLDDAQMQAIAREMNFSETTFVTGESAERATVRIFTPEWELPFAGHPTLGTAWVLAGGKGRYLLDLKGGTVPVEFSQDTAWMTPPPVKLLEAFPESRAAELIGLEAAAIDNRYPVRFAEVGPRFILIGVRTLAELKQAHLNPDRHRQYLDEGLGVQCVFVFTGDGYSADADYACRMFFHSGGYREDPATGSANSAFAAYLKDLGVHQTSSGSNTLIVDQGHEINRPSRLYLKLTEPLQVGGKVQRVCTGQFDPGIL